MNEPDFVYQWTPFLADHLYVNRIGARFNEVCSQETLLYGYAPEVGEPQADLAAHVEIMLRSRRHFTPNGRLWTFCGLPSCSTT